MILLYEIIFIFSVKTNVENLSEYNLIDAEGGLRPWLMKQRNSKRSMSFSYLLHWTVRMTFRWLSLQQKYNHLNSCCCCCCCCWWWWWWACCITFAFIEILCANSPRRSFRVDSSLYSSKDLADPYNDSSSFFAIFGSFTNQSYGALGFLCFNRSTIFAIILLRSL